MSYYVKELLEYNRQQPSLRWKTARVVKGRENITSFTKFMVRDPLSVKWQNSLSPITAMLIRRLGLEQNLVDKQWILPTI